MRLFFRRFRRYVRSRHDWRVRVALRVLYGLARVVVFAVDLLAQIIAAAAVSAFRTTFSGSITAILVKVCAVILLLGLAAASFGQNSLAESLFALLVLPVMLLGLAVMARGVLRRS